MPRFRRRDALRHARLGLLHADKLARIADEVGDLVIAADARCTKDDFSAALCALYKPANARKPPRPKS